MPSLLTFDISDRPTIEFTGPDRAKSLHNLTTQDIQGMAAGQVSECFVTSPQGKTLGFFTIRKTADSIILTCEPGGEPLALDHFAKYTIFDDVRFEVVTPQYEQRLWLGRQGVQAVLDCLMPGGSIPDGQFVRVDRPGTGTFDLIRHDEFSVPGIRVFAKTGMADVIEKEIARSAGISLKRGDDAVYERLRVLSAWPCFPVEIRADNLPQEIDRDATAISFRKGCYLGQETVARLDALGHVNRVLRCFVLESDHVPVDPASLKDSALIDETGQKVGEIRSAVMGEHANHAVGMVLIRTKAADAVLQAASLAEATVTISNAADFRNRFAPLAASIVEKG